MIMKRFFPFVLFALAACGPRAQLTAPAGFARVDGAYDHRVVSPDGVIVAARLESNAPRSDLGFWAHAVDLKLARQGYGRTSASDVKSKDGVPGRLFKYDVNGSAYWVAVFVTSQHVLVTEATGAKADMEASAKELEAAMQSSRVD